MRTFGKTWDRNGESSQQKQEKSRKDSNALVANNETGES